MVINIDHTKSDPYKVEAQVTLERDEWRELITAIDSLRGNGSDYAQRLYWKIHDQLAYQGIELGD